jgi:hypothetical protein
MPTNGNRSHVRGALCKRACDFPLNWTRLRQYLDTVAASGLGTCSFVPSVPKSDLQDLIDSRNEPLAATACTFDHFPGRVFI